MVGLAQQNSKQDSPSILEIALEEEKESNTRLNKINDAIPFDKCVEADKQADEEEKKMVQPIGNMIKEDIVDCPIAVKNLFFYHVKVGELYIKVNAKKKRFEWLNNEGECCYCWSIENPFENPKDKCNFEYQMKYLADQLEAGKVYKLADIITDKVKKKVSQ